MEQYEEYCGRCITGLYRMAASALGSKTAASACVKRVCVESAELCERLHTEREVKVALTRRLYALCSGMGCEEGGLLVALRFASGLHSDEALAVSGLPKELFYRRLASAACASADLRTASVGSEAVTV